MDKIKQTETYVKNSLDDMMLRISFEKNMSASKFNKWLRSLNNVSYKVLEMKYNDSDSLIIMSTYNAVLYCRCSFYMHRLDYFYIDRMIDSQYIYIPADFDINDIVIDITSDDRVDMLVPSFKCTCDLAIKLTFNMMKFHQKTKTFIKRLLKNVYIIRELLRPM